MPLAEGVTGEGRDTQSRPVGDDLDLTRNETKMITQRLRNNQSCCLIKGCSLRLAGSCRERNCGKILQ